jgi:tripartite-type tricarboxylate transporter receptor subunit TctC
MASAQAYPSRPVRLIVGFAAGGMTDVSARLIGQWLSERLKQPIIVENRPGAASNIAADAVAHASADGYTLLMAGTTNTVNATLYGNRNFNFLRDLTPVAGIMRAPHVLDVNPSLPARPSRNSLPTPGVIRASSTWAPAASGPRNTLPENYSR